MTTLGRNSLTSVRAGGTLAVRISGPSPGWPSADGPLATCCALAAVGTAKLGLPEAWFCQSEGSRDGGFQAAMRTKGSLERGGSLARR